MIEELIEIFEEYVDTEELNIQVTEDADIYTDYLLNSFELMEILGLLQDKYRFRADLKQVYHLRTIAQIADYIQRAVAEG